MATKSKLRLFFEIWHVRFWKFFELNLIFVLFCVPLVTIGPAIAGLTRVVRNWSEDDHAFVWLDFWDSFKKNFVRALILGLLDLIILTFMAISFVIYFLYITQEGGWFWYVAFGITAAAFLSFVFINYYAFLMIVSVDISFKDVLKNSFALAIYTFKTNLWVFALTVLIGAIPFILTFIMPFLGFLLMFTPFAFTSFIVSYYCYPTIKKYIIEPFYKDNKVDNEEESEGYEEDYDEEVDVD